MNEVWKDVEGYEGLYQVSNLGRVKSLQRITKIRHAIRIEKEKILKQHKNIKSGYMYVYLSNNGKNKGFRIHRLVAETFIPNPNDLPQINHKDENKENNNVDNLEWCTAKYNCNYGSFIEKNKKAKYKKIIQYDLKCNYINTWNSVKEASIKLNILNTSISKCLKEKRNKAGGYIWKYFEECGDEECH